MSVTSEVTKSIVEYLTLQGFKCWRQNNTRAVRGRIFTGKYGLSDIIGFSKKDGQFLAVEVKIGKDKLSEEQEIFLQEVNKAGGVGIVAQDSLDDFLKKFEAHIKQKIKSHS